jgi:hypothetical protein
MSLLCTIGGHEAGRKQVYNAGFHFGRCRRCRRDIIRVGTFWQSVPRGHVVVWKQGRHRHSITAYYRAHLPIISDRAAAPKPKSEEEDQYSALLALAGLLAARINLPVNSRVSAQAEIRASTKK